MRLLPRSASSTFLMSHAICVGVVAIPLLCARLPNYKFGGLNGLFTTGTQRTLFQDYCWCLCASVVDMLYLCAPWSAGSRTPASLANLAALSVASHVKSGSVRPKWP